MKDWKEQLSYNYPLMFPNHWALPAVGIGWRPIIEAMCKDIAAIDKDSRVRVLQVKEKFGGLRFYFTIDGVKTVTDDPMWKSLNEIVAAGEDLASKTCEYCGKPGSPSSVGGWAKTLCETCAANQLKRRAR